MKKLVTWLSLVVFLVSGFFLADHYLDLRGSWNRMVHLEQSTDHSEESLASEQERPNPYWEDIRTWKNANDDVQGWLDIPGVGLSMPVVQHADNAFYLTRDATGAYNPNGAVFLDYEVEKMDVADHIILYGHNMENGQVFSDLIRFRDPAFSEANGKFILATPEGARTYELLLVADMDLTDEKDFFGFNSWIHWDEEMDARKYIIEMEKRAVVQIARQVAPEDRLLTLSTCENSRDNARCIVVAREVAETD